MLHEMEAGFLEGFTQGLNCMCPTGYARVL